MADPRHLYLGGTIAVGPGRVLPSGNPTVQIHYRCISGAPVYITLLEREAFELAQLLCARLPGLEPLKEWKEPHPP